MRVTRGPTILPPAPYTAAPVEPQAQLLFDLAHLGDDLLSGIIPASDSFVALTITMTFIALFSLV